jgi:hypothetical protein
VGEVESLLVHSTDRARGCSQSPERVAKTVAPLLAIYLKDHLAGATLGRELARRAARNNEGTELGDFLQTLLAEVEEDRATLRAVMGRLEVEPSSVKVGVAWLLEKLGRAKLNGRVRSYSPLSRVLELEGLTIGVAGKRALWRALGPVAARDSRLEDFDFDALAARADNQLAELERHRRAASNLAFGGPDKTGA